MLTKTELRRQLRERRLSLHVWERAELSARICERLQSCHNWQRVQTLHFFEPMHQLGEVDIMPFIEWLQAAHPRVKRYTWAKVGDAWHVTDVDGNRPAAPSQFDVVLVPMLGFDPITLHRLGYGGGYYDRLLAKQQRTRKIGACFEAGKVYLLPCEPHDVPLDAIVTEKKIYD